MVRMPLRNDQHRHLATLPPAMSLTSFSSRDPTTTATETAGLQGSLPSPELYEL